MDISSSLGIAPATIVLAAILGLACAGAFALWRLRMRKARTKTLDLGFDASR